MTPPGTAATAGIVSRGAAYLVDVVIVLAVALASTATVALVTAITGFRARLSVAAALAALPVLFGGYGFLFWGLAGRTPGMALLGIRVVSGTGGPVGWPSAAVRALVLAAFPAGALWCLVDPRRRAVHDILARTLVVHTTVEAP